MISLKGVYSIDKRKFIKGILAAPVAILAILYAGGYISQFMRNYSEWKQLGGYPGDGTSPEMASAGFFSCIAAAFHFPYGIYGIGICIVLLTILIVMVMRMGYSDTGEYDEDRNFT